MWLIQRWHATQRWRLSTTIVAADDDDDATITMTWHALDMHKTYDRPYVCLFVCLSVNSSQTIQYNISCSKLNVAFVLGGFFDIWQIVDRFCVLKNVSASHPEEEDHQRHHQHHPRDCHYYYYCYYKHCL